MNSSEPVDPCIWSILEEHAQRRLHGKKMADEHLKENGLHQTSLEIPDDKNVQSLILDEDIIYIPTIPMFCKNVILLVITYVNVLSYAYYPNATKRTLNVAEYSTDFMTQIRRPVTRREFLSHVWVSPDELVPVNTGEQFEGVLRKGILQFKSSKKKIFAKEYDYTEVVAELLLPYLLPRDQTFDFKLSSTKDERYTRNGFLLLRDMLDIRVFAIMKWTACFLNRNNTYLECHRNNRTIKSVCHDPLPKFCEKVTEEPCDNIYTYLVRMITLDYIIGHTDRLRGDDKCISTNLFREIQSPKDPKFVFLDNSVSSNDKSYLKRLISAHCIFDEDILKRAQSNFQNFTLINSTMAELIDITRAPRTRGLRFDFNAFAQSMLSRVDSLFEIKKICGTS